MRGGAARSTLVFLGVLAVYLANGRAIGAGDTLPASHLPWSLVRERSFALDRFPALHGEAARAIFPLLDGVPYYLRHVDGHYRSAYTPGPAVLALPVHALPIALGARPEGGWASALEKLAAAIVTALSAVVLHRALGQVTGARWALGITLIYAFGTSSWSVSSQALWQHGPSQLFVCLWLLGLVRGLGDERHLARAGFFMGAAVAMRSTDLLLALPVVAWIVWTRPALTGRLALWAAPPLGGLVAYNLLVLGSATGGGGSTTVPAWALFSQVPFHEGVLGVLVSPARGLLVYSPVLALAVVGAVTVWRRGPWAFRMLSLGPPLVILVAGKWFLWWGGDSWGPRLLADTAPVLCFLLYPLAEPAWRRPLAWALVVLLAAWSVGAHAMGAFLHDRRWEGLADVDRNPGRLWSWAEGPLAFHGREASAAVAALVPGAARGGATSATAPEGLRAALEAGPLPLEVFAGEAIAVPVAATNIGRATWLAAAPGDRGAVRLGWRWQHPEREPPGGRAGLLLDVPPGASARFSPNIAAPAVPGEYRLTIDMVSELVTWFADRGSRPVQVIVRVLPLELHRVLEAAGSALGPVPEAAITTDRRVYRAGDRLGLAVALRHPHPPRRLDGYLVLEGTASFIYDGRRLSAAGSTPWPPWVKGLPLPARAEGRFGVTLAGLAPGDYRWHVLVAEVGTYRPIVRASAAFRIEP